MTGQLLTALRTATAAAHAGLHEHALLRDLSTADITRRTYQQVLAGFYGFYQPLEIAYAASQSPLLRDFPAGVVTRRLLRDLETHGIPVSHVPLFPMTAEAFPLEQVIGYLYLREGSNLGGKVISKNLERHLSLQPGIDNHFFWGYGPETGARWQAFLTTLETYDDTVDADRAAGYAASLFQDLDRWLLNGQAVHHAA